MYESISKNNELENEVSLDMSYFWYSDVGLPETYFNWSHFPTKTSVYSPFKAQWPHLQVATTQLEGAFPNYPFSQAGGCLQLISGRTSGQVHNIFSDPMGRWCSYTLQSKSSQKISFIAAYRIYQTARSVPLTAYKQQHRHLITHFNSTSPHPWDAILADLTAYIQSLQTQQHQIFLMWDANSILTDPNIKTFMATCHLYDLQHRCISAIPINTSARGLHRLSLWHRATTWFTMQMWQSKLQWQPS